jgi:hypothetical protein
MDTIRFHKLQIVERGQYLVEFEVESHNSSRDYICLFVCLMAFNATFNSSDKFLLMHTTDIVSSNLDQGEVYNIMW